MEKNEIIDLINARNVPFEIQQKFDSSARRLNNLYLKYRSELETYLESDRSQGPPEEKYKKSIMYREIIADKRFLPLIRKHYLLALMASYGQKTLLNSYVWQDIIKDATGGELKFPEEVPAVSSNKWKREVSKLNVGRKRVESEEAYTQSRTGLDLICGYIQRIDKMLGENSLEELLKHGLIRHANL